MSATECVDLDSINLTLAESIEQLLVYLGIDFSSLTITPSEIRGPCPIHGGDNKTAFVFWNSICKWKCYSKDCQLEYGSNVIGLIRAIKKCSFVEAIEFCKVFLNNNDIKIEQIPPENKIVKQMESIDSWEDHLSQKEYTEECLLKLSSGLIYAKQRGIDPECFLSRGIGFARSGNLKGRIIVPIRNTNDKIVGFTGRKAYETMTGPKWMHFGFETSINLFNIERAKTSIKKHGLVILCEGPFDVIKFEMAGFNNAVAIFGTSIHKEQMIILNKCGVLDVALALDNDKAGNKTEPKNSQIIERFLSGLCIIKAEKDSDFGAMSVDKIKEAIKEAGIKEDLC